MTKLKKLPYFEANMSWNENQQDNKASNVSFQLPEEFGFSTFKILLFYLYQDRLPRWDCEYHKYVDIMLQELMHLYILVDICLAFNIFYG